MERKSEVTRGYPTSFPMATFDDPTSSSRISQMYSSLFLWISFFLVYVHYVTPRHPEATGRCREKKRSFDIFTKVMMRERTKSLKNFEIAWVGASRTRRKKGPCIKKSINLKFIIEILFYQARLLWREITLKSINIGLHYDCWSRRRTCVIILNQNKYIIVGNP